ncbi:acetyl-CoA carboxylase biotin carboxylase subunit [Pontibacter sp. G13]|uniref:acetyl-CoA carboxylase biotin carboxylase subunit n=1 Tax=Pontibacter sp. G13 TaxID=3074898 RepID=UPI00288C4336|nr:acetyl-CoA carboxylase biotin carboxylase subunit [Pontibacter sp. G13]WNJ21075.1 acetyl-CoA carboxylase biotin carboxylase subunit [Pontibacter sp. G13]
MSKIRRMLVANRGEIALRVMRTAREMGIETIAVYSEADRESPHVRFADESFLLGPPPSNQSYLLGSDIIQICLDNQIDAIHPGYGFLSENAAFARAVEAAGITFVGPSGDSMDMMGDKLSAKQAVKEFGVPLVPGLDEAIEDVSYAKQVAEQIGFPVLVKASAGGGGKGMRIVESVDEFESQMERAVSEAQNAFGNGAVFIEKFVRKPRHIEIQVLADSHGNAVHLFERECSIQRRHQKVVEEAPSAVLTPELRKQMGEAAVAVCKACNYKNAGTVEFLLDADHNFYFLEMNTRLQVEHPVTEMITGVDLVKEQIRVAEGEALPFKQEDLEIRGHSIELRVYAEDPTNNFLPDIGKLHVYSRPQGAGVRVDDGFEQGMDVPIYYDPMIAKLVVHAEDREAAMQKMIRAIDEYQIVGLETTLGFGRYVMEHDAFRSGNFDTHFVNAHFSPENLDRPLNEDEAQIAAMIADIALNGDLGTKVYAQNPHVRGSVSAWRINRKR